MLEIDERALRDEPGAAHTWWNAHAAPTHDLLITTPRIHDLIEALHAGDPADHPRIFAATHLS